MSDWKQQIEAQIRNMEDPHCAYSMRMRFEDAATIQALLDVAVAADKLQLDGGDRQSGARSYYATGPVAIEFRAALDKLREVSE